MGEIKVSGVAQKDSSLWIPEAEADFQRRWEQTMISDTTLFNELRGSDTAQVALPGAHIRKRCAAQGTGKIQESG